MCLGLSLFVGKSYPLCIPVFIGDPRFCNHETANKEFIFNNVLFLALQVGTDDNGKIQYLISDLYYDGGINYNEQLVGAATFCFMNCYDTTNWKVTGLVVLTDITPTTWCRSPGSPEGIAGIEHIMEHIAKVVKKDPTEIRLLNMGPDTDDIMELIQDVTASSEFEQRKNSIESFNTVSSVNYNIESFFF